MNAPAPRPWRPGDEPPPGWRRDPEDSRWLRTHTGEVQPGETATLRMRHQRPFYWEGIGPAQPHAQSVPEAGGVPAVEGAADELEAAAVRGPLDSIIEAARGRNFMSLSAWFLCHENHTPALNWEGYGRGGIAFPGDELIVLVRNVGKRAHSFSIVLHGIEDVGLER